MTALSRPVRPRGPVRQAARDEAAEALARAVQIAARRLGWGGCADSRWTRPVIRLPRRSTCAPSARTGDAAGADATPWVGGAGGGGGAGGLHVGGGAPGVARGPQPGPRCHSHTHTGADAGGEGLDPG